MKILAIILSVTGGLSELFGLGMVIREIGSDRRRAAKLIGKTREPRTQRREYPPKAHVPLGRALPGDRATFHPKPDLYDMKAETARAFAQVVNHVIDLRKDVDQKRDASEARLLAEIDQGDDDLRQAFREILESDLTERWVGVIALGVGIVLAAAGSVLGSLS